MRFWLKARRWLCFTGWLSMLCCPWGAQAALEKREVDCGLQMCPYWVPVVTAPAGWHFDKDGGTDYGFNALAPDGATFDDAEVVMYASADPKSQLVEFGSLEQLIAHDTREADTNYPQISVTRATPIATADGKALTSVQLVPHGAGNWERISYLENDDYYLRFVLSARSEAALHAAMDAYEAMVKSYRLDPEPVAAPATAAPSTAPAATPPAARPTKTHP